MGRVGFSAESLGDKPFLALFNANATAKVTLADRQPVSNALAHKPAARPIEKVTATPLVPAPPPATKPTVTRLPDWQASQPPISHESSLHALGTLTPTALGTLLERLAVAEPVGLTASTDAGPHQHLSALNGKWYSKVGRRWFDVMLNDNEDVQIIDSRQTPVVKGPLLTHSAKGEWFIDTRLRLRAGGRRKTLERANQPRKKALKGQLETFDGRKSTLETEMETAEKAATDSKYQTLIETLESQLTAYGECSQQLKNYNALEPILNYRPIMVDCLDNQQSLTQK